MQDWDRLAMIALGVLVSVHPGLEGWTLIKQRKYIPAVGIGILIAAAVGLPVTLTLFAT